MDSYLDSRMHLSLSHVLILQLGTGFGMAVDMYAMANFPTTVESDEFMGRKVVKIAAGDDHSACVTSGGELFVWGMNVKLEPELVSSLMNTNVCVLSRLSCVLCVFVRFSYFRCLPCTVFDRLLTYVVDWTSRLPSPRRVSFIHLERESQVRWAWQPNRTFTRQPSWRHLRTSESCG